MNNRYILLEDNGNWEIIDILKKKKVVILRSSENNKIYGVDLKDNTIFEKRDYYTLSRQIADGKIVGEKVHVDKPCQGIIFKIYEDIMKKINLHIIFSDGVILQPKIKELTKIPHLNVSTLLYEREYVEYEIPPAITEKFGICHIGKFYHMKIYENLPRASYSIPSNKITPYLIVVTKIGDEEKISVYNFNAQILENNYENQSINKLAICFLNIIEANKIFLTKFQETIEKFEKLTTIKNDINDTNHLTLKDIHKKYSSWDYVGLKTKTFCGKYMCNISHTNESIGKNIIIKNLDSHFIVMIKDVDSDNWSVFSYKDKYCSESNIVVSDPSDYIVCYDDCKKIYDDYIYSWNLANSIVSSFQPTPGYY